jgi:hypothetical protein
MYVCGQVMDTNYPHVGYMLYPRDASDTYIRTIHVHAQLYMNMHNYT